MSKRVSLVSLRVMANEKGLSVQVNARAESSGLTPSLPEGRGQTDSWIWKTCSAASKILTWSRSAVDC